MKPKIDITPKTGTAHYEVLINDEVLSDDVKITSMVIDREVGGIPCASLRIIDGVAAKQNFDHSDGKDFVPGNKIEIKAAWDEESAKKTLFKGIVVKQTLKALRDGSTYTVVEAKHEVYKLTLGRRSKVYGNISDEEAIEKILDQIGVPHAVKKRGQAHEHLVQFNSSDWDFLMTRADAAGKLLIITDDQVEVDVPKLDEDVRIDIGFGKTLLEFEAELDSRTQPNNIELRRWLPSDLEPQSDETNDDFDQPGVLTPKELSDTTGYLNTEIHYGGSTMEDKDLKGIVNGRLIRARLSKVRGRAKVVGHEEIQPGIMVELSGMSQQMNGKAFVSGVRHELSRGFWHCNVQFGLCPKFHSEKFEISAPPAAAVMPAISGLQIGVVVAYQEDDKGLERVQVKLPVLGEDFKVLARLSSLYTGNNRGVFFPPHENDEVIIGFIDDDPTQAIIIGSVYNNSNKNNPVLSPDNDNYFKGIYLEKGFNLEFNDTVNEQSVTLQTPGKRKITLDDKIDPATGSGKITIEDDSGNTITMNGDGISFESIGDIKFKGNKVEIESQELRLNGKLKWELTGNTGKVEGSTKLDLSSGMIDLN
jgi:Rhs element Vgr protein